MTVRASKPSLNLREALSELNKPSGVAGEAMLRAETPQEQFNLIGAGRKNLIINGGFDVWQRGTSHNPNSVRYGSADRWWTWCATSGATVSQESTDTDGASYVIKFTTPSNNTVDLRHGIEIFNNKQVTKGGGNLTLSFKAKYPSGSNVNVEARYADNLSFTNSATALSWQSLGAGTGSWETYSVTFPDVTPVASNTSLVLRIGGGAVSSDHLISNVQLELGSVATPFEHRSYGEELALCQRYFCKNEDGYHYSNFATLIYAYTGTDMTTFPVTMRAVPTVTIKSPYTENTNVVCRFYDGTTEKTIQGVTGYKHGFFMKTNDGNLDQHSVGYRWTADAEL